MREEILARDPTRYSAFPHMKAAQWDALLYIMKDLAESDPEHFSLIREGDAWTWRNVLLGITQTFTYGDDGTLPCDPLEFIGRQVQEDLVLLDEREGELHIDALFVTFSSSWSPTFVAGMTFLEMHGKVPVAMADGMIARSEAFIMRLQPNEVYRRLSWGLQHGDRLDVSLDSYPEWIPAKSDYLAAPYDVGQVVHLRVEVQSLIRLPVSGSILFTIHSYLLPVAELLEVEGWAERTANVLEELPPELANYKGLSVIGPVTSRWLRDQLASMTTTPTH